MQSMPSDLRLRVRARVAGRGKVGDLNTRDQSRGKCRALARRRNRHRRRLLRVDREHFRGLELAGREEESARSQRESLAGEPKMPACLEYTSSKAN